MGPGVGRTTASSSHESHAPPRGGPGSHAKTPGSAPEVRGHAVCESNAPASRSPAMCSLFRHEPHGRVPLLGNRVDFACVDVRPVDVRRVMASRRAMAELPQARPPSPPPRGSFPEAPPVLPQEQSRAVPTHGPLPGTSNGRSPPRQGGSAARRGPPRERATSSRFRGAGRCRLDRPICPQALPRRRAPSLFRAGGARHRCPRPRASAGRRQPTAHDGFNPPDRKKRRSLAPRRKPQAGPPCCV
jgi:hypothetical protein